MKKIQLLIGVAVLALATVSLEAQTNVVSPPAGDVISAALQNIPMVPLANESIGISIGALMRGASEFKNDEIVDYTFKGGFFVGGELTASSTAANVIDSAGLRGGISKSWERAKGYGFLEGRRDWSQARWEGVGGVGLAYTPFAKDNGSVLQNFSTVIEQRLVITAVKSAPNTETFLGVRYSF